MNHFEEILLGLDQFVNTLCGGYADESISARCWRMNKKQRWRGKWWFFRRMVDLLFIWQKKHHCCYAYRSEVMRRQYPSEYKRK